LKNKKFVLSIILSILITGVALTLDLLSKTFIFKALPNVGYSHDVIPGFFNFIHIENKGAAWGILSGNGIFLIIISIVVLALYLTFYILRLKKLKNKISITLSLSVGLIAGGCLGNMIDRIFLGYVRDFINLQFMSFPVFNFADMCVTISVILMIIYFLFIYTKEDNLVKNTEKSSKNDIKQPKNEENDEIIEKIEEKENKNGEEK
jgi:signal peptidase II